MMMSVEKNILVILSIGAFLLFGFIEGKGVTEVNGLPYRLGHPDFIDELPEDLDEISGLSYYKDHQVLGVQDEKGIIFVYDFARKEVVRKIKFEKKGDYEGVESVKNKIYVLRSNGDLYKVKNIDEDDQSTKEYDTKLKSKNDTEGLAYDKKNKRLLIACKEKWKIDGGGKKYRSIYAFDLKDKKLDKKAVFKIEIEKVLEKVKGSDFKPSGLSVHPISGDIYIIDSVGKLLVVLNRDGKLTEVIRLKEKLFNQPEGITFLPNGDLLISNESVIGRANIMKFTYHGKQ